MDSNATVIKDNLLIIDGKIEAFGNKAKVEALKTVSYTHLTLPTTPYV